MKIELRKVSTYAVYINEDLSTEDMIVFQNIRRKKEHFKEYHQCSLIALY